MIKRIEKMDSTSEAIMLANKINEIIEVVNKLNKKVDTIVWRA